MIIQLNGLSGRWQSFVCLETSGNKQCGLFHCWNNCSCQTYEGGFSGCPGLEAHGGYAFCGLASLVLLRKVYLCDVQSLLVTITIRKKNCSSLKITILAMDCKQTNAIRRRLSRQNKQTCRWLLFVLAGGSVSDDSRTVSCRLLTRNKTKQTNVELIFIILEDQTPDCLLFNQNALQEYILICCQHNNGGLLDKPGKPRDVYHTCYTLSGLSVAQHSINFKTQVVGPLENKLVSNRNFVRFFCVFIFLFCFRLVFIRFIIWYRKWLEMLWSFLESYRFPWMWN